MTSELISNPILGNDSNFIIILLAFIVGLVVVILLLLYIWNEYRNDPVRRISNISKTEEEEKTKNQSPKLFQSKERNAALESFAGLLDPGEKEIESSRLEMIRAGLYSPDAYRWFQAAKLGGALLGAAIGFIFYSINTDADESSLQRIILFVMTPAALAYYAPISYVSRLTTARREEIIRGFPDALDMMLVCVEGGQTMDQAIQRVGRELHLNFPHLADELEALSFQIQAGKDRGPAMLDFAERCDNDNITSFVNTVIQAQRYGTSMSEALRIYTFEMRDKRSLLAEEKANKLPSKMSIASLVLTVPPLMVILVVPPILHLVEVFTNR